jgi:O-antigen/teichoic acid export membrane protein
MSSEDSTFKPALTLMSGRIAAFAITFLTPVLLARVFTQSEFGTYKQVLLIVGTLYSIGQCGLAECLFYFLPKDPAHGARYTLNSVAMLSISGGACFVGLLLCRSRIPAWMSNAELGRYAPLMGAYLVFMLVGTPLEITMISRKRFKLATFTYIASDFLRAVFLVVPALITGSLVWALAGSAAVFVLRVCATFGYLRSEFGGALSLDGKLLKEQWAYALPFSVSVIVQVIQQNYHQYAVAFHFDAATFAIYSVGCLQIPLVDFMATPASNVMMVRMTEHSQDGKFWRLLPIWHDVTRKLSLMFFPLVGLLIVNAHQLITLLFTNAYAASVPIFMVWCLSILLAVFQTDGVLRVFAETHYLIKVNVVRLGLVVLMMGWFLSNFHLMGAVLITLAGMLLAKIMAMARIRTRLQTTYGEVLPWKELGTVLVVAIVAAIPAIILNAKLGGPALVLLLVSGTAYIVTYGVLAVLLGLLSESERAAIKRGLYVWNRRSVQPERQTGIAGGSPNDVPCD